MRNYPDELKQELCNFVKILDHHEISIENIEKYMDLKKILGQIQIYEIQKQDINSLIENIEPVNQAIQNKNPDIIGTIYEKTKKEVYNKIKNKIITQIPCNPEYQILL